MFCETVRTLPRSYIDDIAVFSNSWEEHLGHLRQVFSRLQMAGLTVKLRKCLFGGDHVPYLGHTIGGGKLQPDQRKVLAVKQYPRPITKKGCSSISRAGWVLQAVCTTLCNHCCPLD